MEARRASIRASHRTQSSSTTLRRRYATTKSRRRWTASALGQGWFRKHSNVERCLKNLELLNQLLDLKFERLRQREADLLREVRHKNHDRARFDALVLRNRTNLESLWIQNIRRPANQSRLAQRSCATDSISFTTESDQKSWSKDRRSKVWDSNSSKRSTDNTRFIEQLGWS